MEYSDKQIQIIGVAEKLFANKGFDGTSVRDIAIDADVNVAMISYYFGSKEKLLEALFSYRALGTTEMLESVLQNNTLTSIEKAYSMIDFFVDKFQHQNDFHKIMSREQVANNIGLTHNIILEFKKRNQQLVKRLIQEGQKAGEFVKNIDVPMLMTILIGTVSHLITTQHFYKEINNLQDIKDEQFQKILKKKLSSHLKFIFKTTLTYEV